MTIDENPRRLWGDPAHLNRSAIEQADIDRRQDEPDPLGSARLVAWVVLCLLGCAVATCVGLAVRVAA